MLIELDSISGNGAQIPFSSNDDSDFPSYIIARPTSLPLKKRPLSFHPTLPSTPEDEIFRGETTPCVKKEKAQLNSNVYEFVRRNTDASCNDTKSFNACYDWLAWRWRKFFRFSSASDEVKALSTVKDCRNRPPVLSIPSQSIWHYGKENKRDWGEERHSDVIYKVVLKRIPKISDPAANKSPDGLQYVTEKIRYIRGATLPHLVGQLWRCDVSGWNDTNFSTVFLSTYRSFTTVSEVLDIIENEKEKLKKDTEETRRPILRSIVRVLRTWLERYFEQDFYAPPKHVSLKRLCALAEELHDDSEETTLCDDDCDFLTFVKSKLQMAEVKSMQEQACLSLTDSFSDIHLETEEISVEDDSSNDEATRVFLQNFTPQFIAEQLTIRDANLLVSLVPHHCLDCVRSSKEKPATVKATIDQFNRVVFCVLGTCLAPNLKMSQRGKVFSKWIEVAKACRELRNFSSLHAIVSGLKAHPIHRLKRTWQQVSSTNAALLEELSQINIKDVLLKSTKGIDEKTGSSSRLRGWDSPIRRNQTLASGGTLHGTVPYLGWFLTDLTYLHTAKPDYIEKKLINFSKMKKEFEMLAQLQLWQASCRSFKRFMSDDRFSDWFSAVTLPTNEQAIHLSEEIEYPQSMSPSAGTPVKRALSDMLAHQMLEVSGIGATLKTSHENTQINLSDTEQGSPQSNGHVVIEKHSSQEERTVTVQLIKKDTTWNDIESPGSIKEMKLSSNDRSRAFIKKALSLFEIEEDRIKDFQLLQILAHDKELRIPDNGNVFYAMNSSGSEFNFTLLECGAEMKRNKAGKTRTLPLASKKKKHTRKTFSTSSMTPIVPVKKSSSIYRHLGMGGIALASGPFTALKEIERIEGEHEKRLTLPGSPDSGRKKKLMEEGLLSSCTNSSNDESADETSSTLRRKMKKLIGKGKGHRRNHSYSGAIQSQSRGTAISQTFKLFGPPSDLGDRSLSFGSYASDSDREEASFHNSVNSSDSTRSSSTMKSTDTSHRSLEDETPVHSTATKVQSKLLRKRESRSKFYVSASQSCTVGSNPDDDARSTQVNSRSISCPVEYNFELKEGEASKESPAPEIRVESPSPVKFLEKADSVDAEAELPDCSNRETMNRRRCASETRTTAL